MQNVIFIIKIICKFAWCYLVVRILSWTVIMFWDWTLLFFVGCDKSFITVTALFSHHRAHVREQEQFICSFPGCNKQYDKACRLKIHLRSHTGMSSCRRNELLCSVHWNSVRDIPLFKLLYWVSYKITYISIPSSNAVIGLLPLNHCL